MQGSRGVTGTPPVLVPVIHVIHVLDYLAVRPGSVPGGWAVYGTNLKHGQCLQLINFNNLGPNLSRVTAQYGTRLL